MPSTEEHTTTTPIIDVSLLPHYHSRDRSHSNRPREKILILLGSRLCWDRDKARRLVFALQQRAARCDTRNRPTQQTECREWKAHPGLRKQRNRPSVLGGGGFTSEMVGKCVWNSSRPSLYRGSRPLTRRPTASPYKQRVGRELGIRIQYNGPTELPRMNAA